MFCTYDGRLQCPFKHLEIAESENKKHQKNIGERERERERKIEGEYTIDTQTKTKISR